jgi:hypothetical protein
MENIEFLQIPKLVLGAALSISTCDSYPAVVGDLTPGNSGSWEMISKIPNGEEYFPQPRDVRKNSWWFNALSMFSMQQGSHRQH